MKEQELIQNIKSFSLFQHLEQNALQTITHEFEIEYFPINANIVNQGDYGDKLYLILHGVAQVFILDKEGHEVNIATLKPGDFFGEIALITSGYRTSSVRATTRCEIFTLKKESFVAILEKYPLIYKEINKILSDRLSQMLNLVAEKKKNTVILLLYSNDSVERMSYFEEYIKKISPKKMLVLENILNMDDLMSHDKTIQDHYILIKNKFDEDAIIFDKTDYIINFVKKEKNQICLLSDATNWNLEHIARVIMNKTVGIALSSGGAPGIAHLGILKVLQEENIPLDYIVGSSAGAFYGGCYAFGIPTKDILDHIIRESNKSKLYIALINFSYKLNGLIRNHYYKNLLKSIIGEVSLEQAKIPFATVASDLFSGQSIVIKEGSAIDAIIASNSAPVLMQPFLKNNYLLIDGVATEPVPIQVLLDEKINIKIAAIIPQLDLTVKMKKDPKLLSIYLRSRSMMAERLATIDANLADVIIKPKVEGIHMLDWKGSHQILEEGEKAARIAIKRIKYLLGYRT